MKVSRADPDLRCKFKVCANGIALQEYSLPHPTTKQDDCHIQECFIEVKEGDLLTIEGSIEGTFTNATVDFIADGSCIDAVHVRPDDKICRSRYKKCNLRHILPQRQSSRRKRQWLCVKNLSVDNDQLAHILQSKHSNNIGIGCLMVMISVSQASHEFYTDAQFDSELESWKANARTIQDSGIRPRFNLALSEHGGSLETCGSFDQNHSRPGSSPWAKLIFYYRKAQQIQSAGCKLRREWPFLRLRPGLPDVPHGEEPRPTEAESHSHGNWALEVPANESPMTKIHINTSSSTRITAKKKLHPDKALSSDALPHHGWKRGCAIPNATGRALDGPVEISDNELPLSDEIPEATLRKIPGREVDKSSSDSDTSNKRSSSIRDLQAALNVIQSRLAATNQTSVKSRFSILTTETADLETQLVAKRQKRMRFQEKIAALEERKHDLKEELRREDELLQEMGAGDSDDA